MVNVERRSCVVIASLLLAACGGGGGGGGQTPNPNPNPNPNPGPGTPVNSAPTIETATFTVAEDSDLSVQLTVADADQDTLTLTSSSGPSLGTIVSLSNAGALVYRPNANVSGSDSFDVTVSDGRGGTASASVTITITPVDDAPVATNDEFAVTGAQLTSLAVLANDPDADGGTPTVTLEGDALVGTATVNSDNTVRIEGLPADFKGLTRFTYRVAAPQGVSTTATAVVFVDTEPFRAVFSLNADDIDSDLVISDFAGEPTTLVEGGTSDQRLRSYIPSKNGATVAFVRADPNNEAETEEICFVKTQGGLAPVCPALRSDLRLTNFAISPNGRWIASGLRNLDGSVAASSIFLIDTENPTGLIIDIVDTPYAFDPRFSADSQYVYFKASDVHDEPALAVYRMDVTDPTHSVRMSQFIPASRIVGYVVSNDGSKIVLQRSTGDQGFYLVEGDAAGVEYPLSQPITSPDSFFAMSTTPLSQDGSLISYVFAPSGQDMQLYVADVSKTTPSQRLQYTFPPGTELSALPDIRSDKLAVLISHKTIGDFTTGQVVEQLIDNLAPATPIGSAVTARYADTINRVVTQQFLEENSGPKRFYVANRPDFDPPTRLGPASGPTGAATFNLDLNNPADLYRGAVLAGVSTQNVPEPSTYSPMLMNLSAPTIFFELSVRDVRNSSFLVGDRLHLVDAP